MQSSYERFKKDLIEQVGLTPNVSDLARATHRSRDYIRETLLYVRAERTSRSTRYPVDDAAKALWAKFEQ